ncbi:MAG: hypothetical protein GDA43_25050 [Hormoscilla sp. SP5CHS1]|nr:hypothetical protein [Hormoscilla sp. SP12CHS1]MBC6456045.1 hypothetical protein [Hormoscilla sp. SP5CHS1]
MLPLCLGDRSSVNYTSFLCDRIALIILRTVKNCAFLHDHEIAPRSRSDQKANMPAALHLRPVPYP